MRKSICITISLISLLTFGLLSGCASFENRAEEKAYVFDGLDAATKQRLKDGEIHVGDTFDMVYIALGAPDEKREKVDAKTRKTIWLYRSYRQDYEGQAVVGYRRYAVRNKITGSYRVYYEPVTQSVYSQRTDDRFRVTFANGKVTELETKQE